MWDRIFIFSFFLYFCSSQRNRFNGGTLIDVEDRITVFFFCDFFLFFSFFF